MGDCQTEDLRVRFDGRLKLKFLGSQVTTDAGLLAYRELDEALGLTEMGAGGLQDSRLGRNKQHGLVRLLRQSIYSREAGYEDVNDAERLCVDPAMRHVVGGRASQPEKQAASTSEVGRFETGTLSTKNNLTALMDLSGRWIDRVHQRKPLKELILDLDSSVSEAYGRQQGTAYNGHFLCVCYHPQFLFNQCGDLERAMLRRGNHASAKDWRRVLLPVIERYRHLSIPKFFRGDAAFANPALYRLLEEEGYRYAIRLKANAVLEREIEHLLTRPVGAAFPQTQGVLSQLPVPGEVVAAVASRGGQDRTARGRVVPAGRFHHDEPPVAQEARSAVLQRSRHGRAVDQGRQERGEVDEALLPHVQGQPSPLAVVRLGVQPGQLPTAIGFAETDPTLDPDDAAGEADQDRGQGDAAREVRDVPIGRGGRHAELVRCDPRPHRAVGDAAASCRRPDVWVGASW